MKILVVLSLFSTVAFGQATCSTSNPCVSVTVTNSFMAGNLGTVNLYTCMGASSSCTQAELNATIASPGNPSVWKTLGPYPQSTGTITYNDPEPYGALMNYAALNSTTTGGPGPVSAILIFQMPQAPALPPAPSMSVKSVTLGNVGVQ